MLESRSTVAKAVEAAYATIVSNNKYKETAETINLNLKKKHNIPISISNKYVFLKQKPIDASDEILYCLAEAMDNIKHTSLVSEYFEPNEIKTYKKYKYDTNKVKFPLKFEATQITDTQWIGRITVKQLMELQPIIVYNENTQRNLKREKMGEVEIYTIFLNRRALDEITKSYQNGSYIPNTITLNIPEDVDFTYENGQLVFKSLETLDILDGYHRYVALSNIYNSDNSFDYVMEVRWVSFNEDKAKQFIWQEDQKTKMTKIESNAFNQNNPGNQLINMLDQVTTLKDIMNRNGNINSGVASGFINLLWFNKPKHTYSRKEIVDTKKIIEQKMLDAIDLKPEAFDVKWNWREIGALFLLIYKDDIKNLFKFIHYINKEEIPIHSKITKREINRLEEAYQKFKG